MHISRVDLNLLVVLDAIYAEGGITKAAERLHLTQPAISHALGRLRDMLEDPLFERKGHTMVPTPLVRRLIAPLRESLDTIGALLNDVQTFDAATSSRRFVIGLRGLGELHLVPALMRSCAAEAPQLEIATTRYDRRRLEVELASGDFDCALDMLLPVSDQILYAPVRTDKMTVVARAGHPAVRNGTMSMESYLEQRHILVSARRTGRGFEDFELRRLGLQRRIALRCQSLASACETVEQTDLLLTLPQGYAESANRALDTQILPFPVELPAIGTYMYWHASMDNDPAHRWLRAQALKAFG